MANSNWDESLNVRHIASNLKAYEAARSSYFTLIVSDLDNLLKINYRGDIAEATDADKIKHAQEYLKLNVVATSVPKFTLGTSEYKRGNDVVRFVGKPEWGADVPLKVDDVVGLDTKSILYAWYYLGYNPNTTKVGKMIDYKKTCTLCEYDQSYNLVRTWTLTGCFIKDIDESEFNKEGGEDKRQITASISYDKCIQELPETETI